MSGQADSARFEALDALRGICALLVALFHIPIYHALKGVGAFANLQFCVDIFFVLSGFVLCHAYAGRLKDTASGIRFTAMRFARLWPLHVTILGLFVVIELTKLVFNRVDGSMTLDSQPFGPGHSLWELATNLVFLQSFGLHPDLNWNVAAWSAAVEFYVSILFAGVILLFPRRRNNIFLGLCLTAGILLYAVSPNTLFVSYDWGFLRATFGFFFGCLAYEVRAHSRSRLVAPTLLEAVSLAAIVTFAAIAPAGGWQYAFPLLAAMLIYIFSFDQGAIAVALRSSALQKLGLWSYSIYMTHLFVYQVVKMFASFVSNKLHLDLVAWHNGEKLIVLGSPYQGLLAAVVLSVALVVPFAALTYTCIERPAMDAARRGVSLERINRLLKRGMAWGGQFRPNASVSRN